MRSNPCSFEFRTATAPPSPTASEHPSNYRGPTRLPATVHAPITPLSRGSRRSRAARRRLMRWGANQRLTPRLQHIHTGVAVLLFPVCVGCGSLSFPPTAPPGRHRLGARASRPHTVPLAAAELQCDAAGSHPVCGNSIGQAEGKPWRHSRLIQVGQMAEAAPGLVRAGRPRSREAFIPWHRHTKGTKLQKHFGAACG